MAEHTTGKGGKDPAEQPGKINIEHTNNGNEILEPTQPSRHDKQQKSKGHSIARGSGAEHSDWINRGRSWAVPIAELIFLVGLVIAVVKDDQLTVMEALPFLIPTKEHARRPINGTSPLFVTHPLIRSIESCLY